MYSSYSLSTIVAMNSLGLKPISQKIPHLIMSLTKKMNSLTLTKHVLGFS